MQTRGNQRELDRARAAKRKEKAGMNKKDDGLTPLQRRERYVLPARIHAVFLLTSFDAVYERCPPLCRDAKAMAEKQAKKEADKAAQK